MLLGILNNILSLSTLFLLFALVFFLVLRVLRARQIAQLPKRTFPHVGFKGYWRGTKSLARCYWLIYGAGNAVIFLLAFLLTRYIMPVTMENIFQFMSLAFVFTVPYMLWSTICVWRCAVNCEKWRGWGVLARLSVAIFLVQTIIMIPQLHMMPKINVDVGSAYGQLLKGRLNDTENASSITRLYRDISR